MIETAADRAAFIADFGVLAAWTVGATTTEDICVLFDNGTVAQSMQDTVSVLNRRATLTLALDGLPPGAGDETDRIVVKGGTYLPKAIEPDGQGFVVVRLEMVVS